MNVPDKIRTLLVTYLTPDAFKADFPRSIAEGGIFIPGYVNAQENETLFLDFRTPTGLCLGELPARVKEVIATGENIGSSFIYMLSREERKRAYENFGGRKEDIPSGGFSLIPFFRMRTIAEFNAAIVEKTEAKAAPVEPASSSPSFEAAVPARPSKSGWEGILDISPEESAPAEFVEHQKAEPENPETALDKIFEDIQEASPQKGGIAFKQKTEPSCNPTEDSHSAPGGAAIPALIAAQQMAPPPEPKLVQYPKKGAAPGRLRYEEFDADKFAKPFEDAIYGETDKKPPSSSRKFLALAYLFLGFIILAGTVFIIFTGDDLFEGARETPPPVNVQPQTPPPEKRQPAQGSPYKRSETLTQRSLPEEPGVIERPEVEKSKESISDADLAKKFDEKGEEMHRKGMTAVAEGFFEKALRLDPESPNALRRLHPGKVKEILKERQD